MTSIRESKKTIKTGLRKLNINEGTAKIAKTMAEAKGFKKGKDKATLDAVVKAGKKLDKAPTKLGDKRREANREERLFYARVGMAHSRSK